MTLPDDGTLAATPLHVVVRDFPETLAVLRRARIDPAMRGGESLAAAGGSDADGLLDAIRRVSAWRTQAGSGRCERAASQAAAHRADAAREADATK